MNISPVGKSAYSEQAGKRHRKHIPQKTSKITKSSKTVHNAVIFATEDTLSKKAAENYSPSIKPFVDSAPLKIAKERIKKYRDAFDTIDEALVEKLIMEEL
ncbi:hypothetical protein QA601_12735 [Chitinispirillales bacterium ANBcel5]|uniref:hypothetical protein n=1 Tax=Cellulosispirillum alkaliphilum TaxID=3039283 RepID=UPI002A518C3F|nr:hypothetical protein [Chitinispirillales bacterium ANBcel5]